MNEEEFAAKKKAIWSASKDELVEIVKQFAAEISKSQMIEEFPKKYSYESLFEYLNSNGEPTGLLRFFEEYRCQCGRCCAKNRKLTIFKTETREQIKTLKNKVGNISDPVRDYIKSENILFTLRLETDERGKYIDSFMAEYRFPGDLVRDFMLYRLRR